MAPKTVAILGASYGGARAAHLLAQGLPAGWRVVLVDRNTHLNHLYVLPRYAVLPGHEHKAFIPYNNVFRPPRPFDASDLSPPPSPANPQSQSAQSPHVFLHAAVTSLSHRSLTLDRAYPAHGVAEADRTLHFDYLVYALGSHLPAPIDLWGPVADEDVKKASVLDVSRGTKEGGIAWLKRFQKRVERASSVLVVGGGALGIRESPQIYLPSTPFMAVEASGTSQWLFSSVCSTNYYRCLIGYLKLVSSVVVCQTCFQSTFTLCLGLGTPPWGFTAL